MYSGLKFERGNSIKAKLQREFRAISACSGQRQIVQDSANGATQAQRWQCMSRDVATYRLGRLGRPGTSV